MAPKECARTLRDPPARLIATHASAANVKMTTSASTSGEMRYWATTRRPSWIPSLRGDPERRMIEDDRQRDERRQRHKGKNHVAKSLAHHVGREAIDQPTERGGRAPHLPFSQDHERGTSPRRAWQAASRGVGSHQRAQHRREGGGDQTE